jgi:hypothetical protein
VRPMRSRWARAPAAIAITASILSVVVISSSSAAAEESAQELPATLKADTYKFDRQARILTAQGNVVFSIRDVTIRADVLVADLQAGFVTAEGHVRLEVAGEAVVAEMLTYSLSTRTGTLFNARTEYRSPVVLGAVKLTAEALEGDIRRFVTIRNGYATTCDEPNPVVFATADELRIFPNDKIIGRQVSLWVGGRRLFTVPFFIFFLRERRETRIAPVVGYSDATGWSIATSFGYFINESHYGFVHADWFERLGVGTGIEHLYRVRGGEGSVLLYRLANRNTGGDDLLAVATHAQQLGDVGVRLFVDQRQLSSVAAPPTSISFISADLSTHTAESSTYLFSTSTQSSVGPTSVVTSRIVHAQTFGPRLSSELLLDYSRSVFAAGIDEQLLPRLTLRYFGEGFTAALVTDTRVSASPPTAAASIERLPELTLAWSPFQIGGTFFVGQVSAGLARFRETTVGVGGRILDAGRADAQVTISGVLLLADGTVGVRSFARETWYATGDVRWFYGGRMDYIRPVTPAVEARFGYTGQTASGASPFLFDQIAGTLSVADAQLTYHSENLLLQATGYYDFQSKLFGDLVGQAIYQPQPTWTVGVAASYNVNMGSLDRVEAALDLQFNNEWRFEYSGAWDAFTQSVLNNRISVTRTFCECMAMSLTYLGARNEIWLEAWLTAIPWGRGKIGIGGQGTILFEQPWWLMQQR